MMRRYTLVLFFFVCIGFMHAEVVRIGLYLHPPIVMKTADGTPYGPGVDYARAIVLAMGYEPQLELLPLARLMTYLKDGSMDMALEFGMTEERKKFLLYSEDTCLITRPSLAVRADYPLASIKSISDVSGMRIGYILGAYPGSFFAEVTDVVFDNVAGDTWIAQNIGKLLAGRIDAVLDQNEYSCIEEARRQGLEDKIRILLLPVDRIRSYVVFSRTSPKGAMLLDDFNALEKTPELDENVLIQKYLERTKRQ